MKMHVIELCLDALREYHRNNDCLPEKSMSHRCDSDE